MSCDEITLTEYDDASIAAAYRLLACRCRSQAADIEGVLALRAGVPYGHPGASSEEAGLLREAATAIDGLVMKLDSRQFGTGRLAGLHPSYLSRLGRGCRVMEVTKQDIKQAYRRGIGSGRQRDLWPEWMDGQRWVVPIPEPMRFWDKPPAPDEVPAAFEMRTAEFRAESGLVHDYPVWAIIGKHRDIETTVDVFRR